MSVDGFATGPHGDLTRLHRWLFDFDASREKPFSDELTARFRAAGAIVFGRRTYDSGQEPWGEEDVFSAPVFVVTHEAKEPVAKNGTVFTFVAGDAAHIHRRASEAAGDGDVVIMGSPDVAAQFLAAGLVDELLLHLVPVLLGRGTRLFAANGTPKELELQSFTDAGDVAGHRLPGDPGGDPAQPRPGARPGRALRLSGS